MNIDNKSIADLRSLIKNAFSGNKAIVKIVLFGSIARGEEKPDSDIDLLIITKDNISKEKALATIDRLNGLFVACFGNSISAIIYSKKERTARQKLNLISRINKEGIVIFERQ